MLDHVQLEFTSLMVLYSRFKIKTFYDVGPLYGYTSSLFTAYLSRFDETMILTSVRSQPAPACSQQSACLPRIGR